MRHLGKKGRLLLTILLILLQTAGSWGAAGTYAAGGFSGTHRVSSPTLTKKKKKKNKNTGSQNSSQNNNNSSQKNNNSSGSQNNNGGNGSTGGSGEAASKEVPADQASVTEDGIYTSKDEVAEYIHLYGHLPDNFITKKEAKKLGWISSEGNLDEVAPGKSIGGDYFGNYEGQLPEEKGRDYYECDIDFTGGRRGAKRIIFSNDGLIFYTEDHYTTFEQLYP